MQKIGAFAAKTHLSQLLDSVSQGESFAITKHGKVVAFIVPAETKPKLVLAEVISAITTLRKKIAQRGVKFTLDDIQKLKTEGRK